MSFSARSWEVHQHPKCLDCLESMVSERWLQPGLHSGLGCSVAAGEEALKIHPHHNILALEMYTSLKVPFWYMHQNELFSAGLEQLWAWLIWHGVTIFPFTYFPERGHQKRGFWNMFKHKLTELDYSQTEWQITLSLQIPPDRLTAALLSPASFLTAPQISFPSLDVSLPWRGVQSPGYRPP